MLRVRCVTGVTFSILAIATGAAHVEAQARWEDVAVDFARSVKHLRSVSPPADDPRNDTLAAVLDEARKFTKSHDAEGFSAIDLLACAARSADGLTATFAVFSLANASDRTDADAALLTLLQDPSRSRIATLALSYLPPESARPLLEQALRSHPQAEAARLLAVVGDKADLELLQSVAASEALRSGPRATTRVHGFGAGGGSNATGDDAWRESISNLEFRMNLPAERRADWQRQEMLFVQACDIMPGLRGFESNYVLAARWSRSRGDTYSAEFLRHKLAGPEQPDASVAAALAGELRVAELIPDLRRLASANAGPAAQIAKSALMNIEGRTK